jgi:hypothetical protein
MPNTELSRLNVQLPTELLGALEDLRYMRSKQSGRRISTRALAQEAISMFVASQRTEVRP